MIVVAEWQVQEKFCNCKVFVGAMIFMLPYMEGWATKQRMPAWVFTGSLNYLRGTKRMRLTRVR
jgi:hypothetical protein